MLKFSTTTPFCKDDSPDSLQKIEPLIVPPKGSTLKSGKLIGKKAYIVGNALAIAGFYLPCFFDGDITELDKPDGNIIMVVPSGEYPIKVTLDKNKNYLLDLK